MSVLQTLKLFAKPTIPNEKNNLEDYCHVVPMVDITSGVVFVSCAILTNQEKGFDIKK